MGLRTITEGLAREHGYSAEHLYDLARHGLALIEALAIQTGRCTIQGFGTFKLKTQAARQARNPRTGEPVQVSPCHMLTFHPETSSASQGARAAGLNSSLGRLCAQMSMHYERAPSEILWLITAVLKGIEQEARRNGKCTVRGLGTFKLRATPQRMARNPATGAPALVPPREKLVFRQAVDRRRALAHALADPC